MVTSISRRDMLFTLGAGVISVRGDTATALDANKPLRGALLILHTPFTATGAVDWEDLAREAAFVDRSTVTTPWLRAPSSAGQRPCTSELAAEGDDLAGRKVAKLFNGTVRPAHTHVDRLALGAETYMDAGIVAGQIAERGSHRSSDRSIPNRHHDLRANAVPAVRLEHSER